MRLTLNHVVHTNLMIVNLDISDNLRGFHGLVVCLLVDLNTRLKRRMILYRVDRKRHTVDIVHS
jgi:hypothetical protein